MSITVSQVEQYILENILHSSVWDSADEIRKLKAVNNAKAVLLTHLSKYFSTESDLTVAYVAHQCNWLLRIDDTLLRAEMGITYIQMSGVMVNIKDKDNSIAPFVLAGLGLKTRKVASYESERPIGTPNTIFRGEP
jgi:hypothetical protein